MKSPKRHRPAPRTLVAPPGGVDMCGLAKRVKYIGSPEHKESRSFAGWPRPRADATICDPALAGNQDELTEWLRAGLRQGTVGAPWEGDFPRYVWHRVGDAVYEGRLVNSGKGEYKGYELTEEETPRGI